MLKMRVPEGIWSMRAGGALQSTNIQNESITNAAIQYVAFENATIINSQDEKGCARELVYGV
jgi:hypothetical protein